MLKTMTIDGQDILFKASASFAYRYKNQFGTDVLKEIIPAIKKLDLTEKEITVDNVARALEGAEITLLYNIIWIMAKTADDTIKEPVSWYDAFESFPIIDVAKELFPMFVKSILTTKEIKKKTMETT